MTTQTAFRAVRSETTAEYFYDYAGQDPINGYDLDGTMLSASGIGDCEIGSCGGNAPTFNPTGINPTITKAIKTAAGYVEAAGNGCVGGVVWGLGAGAVSGADFTGYGALAAGGIGCARGAAMAAISHAAEQSHVPGASFLVTAVDWGSNARDMLGAFGERLTKEGFVMGFGMGLERTPQGVRFVWGILIARSR